MSNCSKDERDSANKNFTGEEFFRGIFFMQGQVEDAIPSYRVYVKQLRSSPQALSEISKLSDEIVSGINKIDPGYFSLLKKAIDSKDFYMIKQMLEEANTLYLKAGLISTSYSSVFRKALGIATDP